MTPTTKKTEENTTPAATPKKLNPWFRSLYHFKDIPATVTYLIGNDERRMVGKVVSFSPDGHHLIMKTDDGKTVFVRLPLEIVIDNRPLEVEVE